MNRDDSHPVDSLVQRYLERQAGGPEAEALSERILNSVRVAQTPRASRKTARFFWFTAALAASLMAFLGGWYLQPLQANPQAVVRDALQAHSLPVDRLYLVETRLDPRNPVSQMPGANHLKTNLLWTRGNHFLLVPPDGKKTWAMGRDSDNDFWMAIPGNPGMGMRMPMEELPEPVRAIADLLTMRMETLLNDVLVDFHLEGKFNEGGIFTVAAYPKFPGPQTRVSSVFMEIDSPTRVVRKVVIAKINRGLPVANVTFRLVEIGNQPDNSYSLEGHLGPQAQVHLPSDKPSFVAIVSRLLNRAAENKRSPRPGSP
ncbi:MAG: hypothetical protein EXR99_07445 [Gemmataceae bacterium]|nr:hypothetical protein [Gemmataceae bacterium]